jgi:osmoprotectant transport system substrate-binding protein
MQKRASILLTLIALLAPLLAACGGTETDTAGTTSNTPAPAAAESPASAGADSDASPAAGSETTPAAGASTSPTAGSAPAAAGDKSITIGSKDFTEQFILCEVYGQALEAKGYKFNRKCNLGSEQIADKALTTGQIDMYPEYTGTMLTVLKVPTAQYPKTPDATYDLVKQRYAERQPPLTLLEPAPFENNYGIVVTKEAADQYNLKTLADLAKAAPNLTIASFSQFESREDGRPNLNKSYPGLDKLKTQVVNEIGLRYQALEEGKAQVGVGFTTDGQLADENLVVLEDPKRIWPAYFPTPVFRADYLESHPDVAQLVNEVTSKLTIEKMRELNALVDLDKEEPVDVAAQFLQESGLAGGQ